MSILIDSSIWIEYFKSGNESSKLDSLLDENLVVTNDIILTELIPFLKIKKQLKVIQLLREISCLPLHINWDEIIDLQVKCLKNGSNGIGIPDLIIAQNAKLNNCKIYSLDKHFSLISQVSKVKLF
ncbi:MAG: PIN domain-containing protein [Candidatus Brocadiaceae bacterium]|nr:PIN domain-containing protein [Candidatus Brocadiaceae bacterium]